MLEWAVLAVMNMIQHLHYGVLFRIDDMDVVQHFS
jgi:hypothetical protein